MPLRRVATLVGLAVGVGALLLQFWLSMSARLALGGGIVDALLWFFTYFTILTNLMLVLVYLSDILEARWLAWWRSPVTRGMMAAAMTLVMGFYHLVLAATWDPQGLFHLADVLLHYATPLIYLAWWFFFEPKGRLRFGDVGFMLVPTFVWLTWTMLRGAVLNEYPFPVLEAHLIGYPQVLTNVAGLLLVLVALFVGVVALDRLLGRRRPAAG